MCHMRVQGMLPVAQQPGCGFAAAAASAAGSTEQHLAASEVPGEPGSTSYIMDRSTCILAISTLMYLYVI